MHQKPECKDMPQNIHLSDFWSRMFCKVGSSNSDIVVGSELTGAKVVEERKVRFDSGDLRASNSPSHRVRLSGFLLPSILLEQLRA